MRSKAALPWKSTIRALYFIRILTVAFLPLPSVAAAVMETTFPFPAFFAFTFPSEVTVAYFVLDDVHFSVLFASFPFVLTVVLSFMLFPAARFFGALLICTPVTACLIILILMEAFLPLPSVAVAVIVTFFPAPAFFVVTTPLLLTVAYFVLPDFQRSP